MSGLTLRTDEAKQTITDVYENAKVTWSGEHATTVNQLTDQLPALEPQTLDAAASLLIDAGEYDVDKLVVEEDKGLPFGVPVAQEFDLPLAVARWYTYDIDCVECQTEVDIESEYFSGNLYLNGIEEGDSVAIIDDTISTGGTMTAVINAVEAAGASVEEAHCIIEKTSNSGVERVKEATGVEVTTEIPIEVVGNNVNVLEC